MKYIDGIRKEERFSYTSFSFSLVELKTFSPIDTSRFYNVGIYERNEKSEGVFTKDIEVQVSREEVENLLATVSHFVFCLKDTKPTHYKEYRYKTALGLYVLFYYSTSLSKWFTELGYDEIYIRGSGDEDDINYSSLALLFTNVLKSFDSPLD